MSKVKKGILIVTVLAVAGYFLIYFMLSQQSSSIGTITEINQERITILIDKYKEENSEKIQGDLAFRWEQAAEYQVGDRIKIYMKDPILTSFPGQATVTEIKKIDEEKNK